MWTSLFDITRRSNTLASRSALMHNDGNRRPSSIYKLGIASRRFDVTSDVTASLPW